MDRPNISLACRKAGIARRTYYDRRADGWTHEEALGIERRKKAWGEVTGFSRLLATWKVPA